MSDDGKDYIWVDKNVEAVSDKLKSRMEVGFKKYGCTTERTDLDLKQWLTHLSEELLDSSVYLERIMQELKPKKDISNKSIELFYKEYDGESMYDFYRDVSEATVAEYNPLINEIPLDEDGFPKGKFTVTFRWDNE